MAQASRSSNTSRPDPQPARAVPARAPALSTTSRTQRARQQPARPGPARPTQTPHGPDDAHTPQPIPRTIASRLKPKRTVRAAQDQRRTIEESTANHPKGRYPTSVVERLRRRTYRSSTRPLSATAILADAKVGRADTRARHCSSSAASTSKSCQKSSVTRRLFFTRDTYQHVTKKLQSEAAD